MIPLPIIAILCFLFCGQTFAMEQDTLVIQTSDSNTGWSWSSLRSMTKRSFRRQLEDVPYPLHRYNLTFSATTPWQNDNLGVCNKDNYTYPNGNPENYTWYGLRVILPDNYGGGSFWWTSVASMVKENGFQQPYGEEEPAVFYVQEFESPETMFKIQYTINDAVAFSSPSFDFEGVEEGEMLTSQSFSSAVHCEKKYTIISICNAVLTVNMTYLEMVSAAPWTVSLSASATAMALALFGMFLV